MKKNNCITFFVASILLGSGLSDETKENGNKYKDHGSEETRNIQNNLDEQKRRDIRGVPISHFAALHSTNIEHSLYGDKTGHGYQYYERNGHQFEFDAGNPDVHGEIVRPCQAYDLFCIRKFFADHSNCKISGRPVPDPLYRADQGSSVHFASNNMSQTQVNAYYSGLNNARVSEFYINKVTDNLVIAVTFDRPSKYSNNTYMMFYTKGREPIVTRDYGGILYSVLTVTVIIPQLNNLRLDRSEIYTYADDAVFPFNLGPRIGASTDPEVVAMYARFYTNIPVEYQEEITNQGSFMVGNYIQYNICDFGLKVL